MEILQTGIDISAYQRTMALSGAKAEGFTFAILKAGGSDAGIYIDPWFERHYATAKALGIQVGAYWYMGEKTVDGAKANAQYMVKHCLKGKQFELPIYLDVEGSMLRLGKRLCTDIIKAWCTEMERLGYWAGVYATLAAFQGSFYDEELERYAHWVAQWSKTLSYNKPCCGLWQYGGETNLIRSNKVAGVICDQDYLLIDYATKIREKGLNGYGKTEQEPAGEPETAKKTYTVLVGGLGEAYAKALVSSLEADGYNPTMAEEETQEADTLAVLDVVRMQNGAPVWGTDRKFNSWVYERPLYIRAIDGDKVTVSIYKAGDVTGDVDQMYLDKV